ncbi:MAG: type IV toxin-antitoxin system AbiEi family antitoxin, partial [Flavobacteriaceae bacterium]|nr:type IV toxin-antitoxin system AbiEi family antitoxin [Flavobacteriaceae bacterium]
MNTKLPTKINQLLQKKPQGTLFLSSWLLSNGISYDLQRSYKNSQWFTSIASGVMYRTGDTPTIYSAVACLNQQDGKHFHIGAMTALDIQGFSHYLPMGKQTVVVFSPKNEQLPKWFLKRDWDIILRNFTTNNFDNELAITEEVRDGFTLLMSERERAFMECLHLAPEYYN